MSLLIFFPDFTSPSPIFYVLFHVINKEKVHLSSSFILSSSIIRYVRVNLRLFFIKRAHRRNFFEGLVLNYQNLLHSINQGNTGKSSKMPMATGINPAVRDFCVNKVVYSKPMTCWGGSQTINHYYLGKE